MGLARTPAMLGGSVKLVQKSLDLTGNNTTLTQDIFTLSGSVVLHALWFEVTTVISGAMTLVGVQLKASGGTSNLSSQNNTMSSYVVGSVGWLLQRVSDNLRLCNPNGAPVALGANNTGGEMLRGLGSIVLVKQPGADTKVVLNYTTTATPLTGTILFNAYYEKITSDGNLVAV